MRLFRSRAPKTVIETLPTAPPRGNDMDLELGNVQGIGTREEQEDSFAFSGAAGAAASTKDGLFAVLADGMGGLAHGRACSEAAVSQLCAMYAELSEPCSAQVLQEGVKEVNRSLFSRFRGESGTTVVAVFLNEDGIHWMSVGDSAVFLRRGDGLYQLNCAQNQRSASYIQALSHEPMDPMPARQDADGARLRGFLGMPHQPELDHSLRPLPLQPGDTFLLCSDGVSGVLSQDELMKATELPPADGCSLLEKLILEKRCECQDNYTGILITYRRGETQHE